MTIWYISKYAVPEEYGAGTRHFYLSAAWARRGHRAVVITSNSNHLARGLPRFEAAWLREELGGVDTVWLDTLPVRQPRGLSRVMSWLHFEWRLLRLPLGRLPAPDVVIASSLSLLTVLNGYRIARRFGARFVFEVRDVWPMTPVEAGGYSPNHPFIRLLGWVERFGYRRADVIVGTMPNLRARVEEVAPEAAGKVACIPQGVSLRFHENGQEALAAGHAASVPTDAFVVAYAGSMSANNPLGTLVEAARLLRDEPGLAVVLLGGGTEKERLREQAEGLSNVVFLDPVPKEQVQDFLARADVCYDGFTSRLARYGLSRNKWIDYMYAGRPVICSYDGYRSMIDEAEAGSFVPYGDARALADEILRYKRMPAGERRAMGERARAFITERRTYPRLAEDYEALFSE